MANPILDAARSKRVKHQTKLDEILVLPTTEARELNEAEVAEFEERATKITGLDTQIELLEAEEVRKVAAAKASAEIAPVYGDQARISSEPMTYDRAGSNSYFRDMGMIAMSNRDAAYSALGADAIARMQRHGSEVEIEARTNKRLASELHEVRADLKSRAGASGEYEQRVTPSGAAGFGGELIPPVWLVDQTAKFLRPGRVFADRVTKMPLMPGTNSINWPKLTLGTLTGPQSGQNAPVSSQDFTTTSVNAPVLTYAGQADVSLQMIEQSPLGGGVDGLLSDDLGRDLDQRLDIAIISGSGVNGQHLGLLNVPQATSPSVSQMSSVACTSTTFFDGITTAGTQYRAIINAVNQIETLTFSTFRPTAIWCHPRRSNSWAITATDSNKRPLFVAPSYQAFSNLGINEASPVPEGLAGELYGLGVYKDANMNTTNLAAATTGGTQDPIIVLNESVPILFEGAVRYRALPEVLSGTLAVRFQKYQYSAWMPTRFPQAIAVITGAGVVGPTF